MHNCQPQAPQPDGAELEDSRVRAPGSDPVTVQLEITGMIRPRNPAARTTQRLSGWHAVMPVGQCAQQEHWHQPSLPPRAPPGTIMGLP
jgi:hypothetical protein